MMQFEEFKTYTVVNVDMVHTGYLIVSDDYPLKQVLRGAWDELKESPLFKLNTSKYVGRLQNAQ